MIGHDHTPERIFVLDIDNTVFDWVTYYVHAIEAMYDFLQKKTGVPVAVLAEESKLVFEKYGSIEYPFLVQELPSIYRLYPGRVDELLDNIVTPARQVFLSAAEPHLKPFPTVLDTLKSLQNVPRHLPIVALSDAPHYVAMWKLNKLGLLHFFDAIYALDDPKIPVEAETGTIKVKKEILLKHLSPSYFGFKGRTRVLPGDYEKPRNHGLKTILMDYSLDETQAALKKRSVWLGDNLSKDVRLGKQLGITTVWARYGVHFDPHLLPRLASFSPAKSLARSMSEQKSIESLADTPDYSIDRFSEVRSILDQANLG